MLRSRLRQCVLGLVVCGLVAALVVFARPSTAAQEAKAVWQYRQLEVQPGFVQANLEELGRDGWEVFDVYAASTLTNDGGMLKMVPHTFYVFAKRRM